MIIAGAVSETREEVFPRMEGRSLLRIANSRQIFEQAPRRLPVYCGLP